MELNNYHLSIYLLIYLLHVAINYKVNRSLPNIKPKKWNVVCWTVSKSTESAITKFLMKRGSRTDTRNQNAKHRKWIKTWRFSEWSDSMKFQLFVKYLLPLKHIAWLLFKKCTPLRRFPPFFIHCAIFLAECSSRDALSLSGTQRFLPLFSPFVLRWF